MDAIEEEFPEERDIVRRKIMGKRKNRGREMGCDGDL